MPGPVSSGLVLTAHPPGDPSWRERLAVHLLRLDQESRLQRFLTWSSDAAVARYAATTGPTVVVDAARGHQLCGIAEVHIRAGHRPVAEIALSVEEENRRAGIGAALFDKALRESRLRGVWEIWIIYLKTNEAIRRISERAGFRRIPDRDPSAVQALVGRPPVPDELRLPGAPARD
ncbi:GNAT family N-acetyltransferase [Defluviimonas sp. WL0024]|uniref:GNAT family N-acetyltransferase n=2 Tax=Albidovulum TaxID=205889 RepID=A0ABT3J2Q8_9RHOB|nr:MULTISPECIES: GNAT family N-acetyltransferase [Defluviimonas]MCU9847619.1 GNAT family N-acetyltransferase [Defluviimonas sp. WL0024]MCW3781953.1 GNAT family N-acetyltransferase [Defluviimonas salinarum]